MSNIRNIMKQAHSNTNLTPSPVQVNFRASPQSNRPIEQPESPVDKQEVELPTGVLQIAREDVPVTDYGIRPVATNFNCYNKEVFKWLREFSSSNQFSGGVPITKSQVIEIALDVIMYDLDIKPIGYKSQQELREAIQNKIRG